MEYQTKNALISVSDKTDLIDFAKKLQTLGIHLLASGGTGHLLKNNAVEVEEVSDYTEFPEILEGRVKTLHPKIHGGILAKRDKHQSVLQQYAIHPIDIVVVNLYPFAKTIARENVSLEEAIENIDIGGPALIRAAAKNFKDVLVVVDIADYQEVITRLQENRCDEVFRFYMASKAFAHTSNYDTMIANYLQQKMQAEKAIFPPQLRLHFVHTQDLRYGENPHQKAAFYKELHPAKDSLSLARQLQGKALSFNNLADADTAWECVKSFVSPSCVIVKHANPCGVASSSDLEQSFLKAFNADPVSAFGGIIAFNEKVNMVTAAAILEKGFFEVIIAPFFDPETKDIFNSKKNLRILETAFVEGDETLMVNWDYKAIGGGLLVQERDNLAVDTNKWKVVSKKMPSETEYRDLVFAWQVCRFVKSNAIIYAKSEQTLGVGSGQTSRVDSARCAAIKAKEQGFSLQGAVMASEAFFPFRDSIDIAAKEGITAVIHPGGSVKDEEVIQAANEHGIAMIFTGMRHFRH